MNRTPNIRMRIASLTRVASLAGLTVLGLVVCSSAARAQYLDPGTGSYLFQLLIAGGTALLYSVYRNRDRVKHLFKKISGR